jgi:hypothetical protein
MRRTVIYFGNAFASVPAGGDVPELRDLEKIHPCRGLLRALLGRRDTERHHFLRKNVYLPEMRILPAFIVF